MTSRLLHAAVLVLCFSPAAFAQQPEPPRKPVQQIKGFEFPFYDGEDRLVWVVKGEQADLFENGDTDITNAYASILDAQGNESYAIRSDRASIKGSVEDMEGDLYLTGNVRAYGTSMGQESKTLHTISKLLNKTVSGMV